MCHALAPSRDSIINSEDACWLALQNAIGPDTLVYQNREDSMQLQWSILVYILYVISPLLDKLALPS